MSEELELLGKKFKNWKKNKVHRAEKMPDELLGAIFSVTNKFSRKEIKDSLGVSCSDISKILNNAELYGLKQNKIHKSFIELNNLIDSDLCEKGIKSDLFESKKTKKNIRKGFILKLQGFINLKISMRVF
jgi:hypothetical protein